MELIRKPIHYTQEGKSIFDQFYLDEDYNVPDQKEDVQRIIQGNAELKPEDIRPVENYVKITGKVYFKVLYMTASGDPRPAVLEGKIPFEEMVYAEGDGNENVFLEKREDGIYGDCCEYTKTESAYHVGDGSGKRMDQGRRTDGRCGERRANLS